MDLATGIISGSIASGASTTAGSKDFTVTVTAVDIDNQIADTVRTFTWSVTNVAPTATNDTGAVAENATLSGNSVITNDADGVPDNDVLTVTGVTTGTAANVGAVGILNVGSSLAGTYGHLTISANGGYTYAV